MNKDSNFNRNTVDGSRTKGFRLLEELALNLRWSWNHSTDKIWRQLDPVLWEVTSNPWVVLQTISHERLNIALSDTNFYQLILDVVEANRLEEKIPAWFQKTHPGSPLTCVAYFSMEFMLTEALPIYSGGLGNVAGDQLKAASDLSVPVIAIGLLYQQGYFRQALDKDGNQLALYPYNDPGQLPITPLRKKNGEWLRLEIALPGYSIWVRAWEVHVGRVKLYLLDSNDPANFPAHRGITSELYGGGPELRLQQEILLGIGGWRLLNTLGIEPEVCHLNEGHAAFAVLERAYSYMQESKESFDTSLAVTRAGNVFTTHTAVPAGFDRFSPDLIEKYLSSYAESKLGISLQKLLALGRIDPNDPQESFNMAYLAIRGSSVVSGVSRLHGEVSRKIFAPLFPRWPTNEVPIKHVTNGVHVPSWDSAQADDLWTKACGKSRWLGNLEILEKQIRNIGDDEIWEMRNQERKNLIEYARKRLARDLAIRGKTSENIEQAKTIFDKDILTLGFARRFATYKRPNLLLQDPERLMRILTNPKQPIQLIIAGKAHPQDKQGQAMIKQWIDFIQSSQEARHHVMFLSDYDMLLTEKLVRGVDVWINTPERPWEACGTSGMKVLVNGGINLSELDGWWAEAYSPEVGWSLGDGKEHSHDPTWNTSEAHILYDLLEREIAPAFYHRDNTGIPASWIARIRQSMSKLTPYFSANRAVREYTERYYIPSAIAYRERTENHAEKAKQILAWYDRLKKSWGLVKFGAMKVETKPGLHHFEVELSLDGLNTRDVKVELFCSEAEAGGGAEEGHAVKYEMTCIGQHPEQANVYLYQTIVPSPPSAASYTPRVIPHLHFASIPLENNLITWQR